MPLPRYARRSARLLASLSLSFAAAALAVSCSSGGEQASSGAAPSASAAAAAPSSSAEDELPGDIKPRGKDDDIKPLYPNDGSPPDPLAVRYCEALHDVEPRRKGECCGSPGGAGHFTGECARVLGAAIRLGAVRLDAAAVERCSAAVAKELDGCGWVGPSPPSLPAECDGVITGLVAEKAVCRSSLECAEGRACQGLTATRTGKCLPPKPAGLACGGAVDTLAALTRQNREAERHRECEGFCARPVCTDTLALGAACKADGQCGQGRTCLSGKCSEAPLPDPGKPCAAGRCAPGARCVKDRCIAAKAEGEACESDLECRGACVTPAGAAAGQCGKRCTAATIPTQNAFTPKSPPPPRRGGD